jgi:starch-binding outer membrane protein SusE/F
MRNWLNKLIVAAGTSVLLLSCEKDETKTVFTITATPSLTATATTLVLQQANANNNAVTFNWTNVAYSFDAAISYELQISKAGTNFAAATTTPVQLSTTAFTHTMKVIDLNRELLKIVPHSIANQLEIRVTAKANNSNATAAHSNVVAMTVTAYRDLIVYNFPAALNVAGNFQGWSPGTAPQIVNQNNGGYNGYEGYINFTDPSPAFKLVKGNDWPHGDHGSAGPGQLTASGGPNLTLAGAGIYRIRANTTSLTWSNEIINGWGVIGDATPDGWNSDQNMTYNTTTKAYQVTLNLVAGVFKFRANDAWAINFGDNGNDGKMEYDGANIPITVAGNYTLTLDLSAGGNYAYTIKKN